MGEGGCFDETFHSYDWCKGIAASVRGDESAARAAFENARKELAEEVNNQPDYAAALCALVWSMPYLGNKEAAIRERRTCVRIDPN